MKYLILFICILSAGCATTQHTVATEVNGQKILSIKINATESVYVANPAVACIPSGYVTDGTRGVGLLMYYTEAQTKKMTVAVWNQWGKPLLQSGQTLPAYAEGYGKELCKQYNKR